MLSLKQQFMDREGMPVEMQRFVYKGKNLLDEGTLASFEVVPDSTIYLTMSLKGGI